uniref:GDP-fucose protein O-fucosyltransferase 2 n=1 Tax=viral metagenome TaxID=1070528 RepID=A0A6C0AXZ8_9ZZZZ|tara:strand:- start:5652 stop:7799 length:2148 start_codon:yes stop_codon:yes gene_type:complete
MDNWISPFSIKIMHNFLNDDQYSFIQNLIKTKNFIPACQTVGKKNIVQEEHKIRLDYTLTNPECAFIDKPLIYKADCNCNLRERWRLLYYDGDGEKKHFRDAHTDWTNYSCHRRMSIIIGLVNPDEYEGGELVFPNNNLKYKIEKGSAVIFDSKLLHEVLPVTKGKRYVLQCFMLDDSGYDLKREKNGKQNFALLGPEPNITFKINEKDEKDDKIRNSDKVNDEKIINNEIWTFSENKNIVHSRLASSNEYYIGSFTYMQDLLDTLEKNKEIVYFTWHKPNHTNLKWSGRAYGWTSEVCKQKQRTDPSKWPKEYNVLSGYKNNMLEEAKIEEAKIEEAKIEEAIVDINLTDEERNNKYLTNINTDGGPGNQIVGIKEMIIMSKILDRKMLMPPIIQHYVLNRRHRGMQNNNKYWKFSDVFTYNDDGNPVLELMDNKHLLNCSNSQYYTRIQDITNALKMESLLELNSKNKVCLKNRTFKNYEDYKELREKTDHILKITHLYNCTAISKCCWNGCDTCEMNPIFFNMYKDICSKFEFSEKIREFGDEYINANFGNSEYITLHLRYSDYGDDNDLKDVTKLYNESDINKLITKLCIKEDISLENVFIATSNQNRLLKSDLKGHKLFPKDVKYNEFESFIEQYICSKSKIFIYTGGATDRDKGKHQHLRSTWASFVIDYRTYLLNKEKSSNYYLSDYFKNTKESDIKEDTKENLAEID